MWYSSLEKPVGGSRLVIGYLGLYAILVGMMVLMPLATLIFYPSEANYAPCFVLPGIISVLIGYVTFYTLISGREKDRLRKNDGPIIIVSSWLVAILVCAIPFVLSGNYNFTQAIFETTSGLTTTGLSITDVANCPHIFLIHRSLLHFFGGVGLVLIMVSVFSDSHGLTIYNAEGHTDKLLPNMAQSARMILGLYAGFILAGILAYCLAGMPLFDAINTSISALSTGGFTVNPESIGGYHSATIEVISIILMLLGATNFLLNFLLLRGDFRAYFLNTETKAFYLVIGSFTVAMAIILLSSGFFDTAPTAFLESLFMVVSVITTTGFQTISSFALLPSGALFLLMLLMLMGSETGSTAGGIKIYRIAVLVKSLLWSLRAKFAHRRSIFSRNIERYGERKECTETEQRDISMFINLYITVFLIGTFIFTLTGYSLQDSAFEFASALGDVGVSIGVCTAGASPVVLWTGAIGMLVGRLELIPVFIGVRGILSDARRLVVRVFAHTKSGR